MPPSGGSARRDRRPLRVGRGWLCVLLQPEGTPEGGAPCWGSGFLPAVHQGTLLRKGSSPVLNLRPPKDVQGEDQQPAGRVAHRSGQ